MSKPHTGLAQPADRLHLLPRHWEMLVALLREHLPGIEVWAYGSRVNGQSHDGSDLDLVLRSPDLQEIPVGQVADFQEALRESSASPARVQHPLSGGSPRLGTPAGELSSGDRTGVCGVG